MSSEVPKTTTLTKSHLRNETHFVSSHPQVQHALHQESE